MDPIEFTVNGENYRSVQDGVSIYAMSLRTGRITPDEEVNDELRRLVAIQDSMPARERSRHYSKHERERRHQPESDWCEGDRGEYCKNACTMDVQDIISKHSEYGTV